MSTAEVNWQVDEINSALNEEFDQNFDNIEMEISNPFNMNETLLALPTLKNEQSTCNNFDNKFRNTNQDQTMTSVSNMSNSINTFNDNNIASSLQNLTNIGNEMTKNLTNQSMSTQNLSNQAAISNGNNDVSNSNNISMLVTNQSLSNCQKTSNNNNVNLSKFSNQNAKASLCELNKLEQQNTLNAVANVLNANVLKRSPVESPNNLLEMQQNSPISHSENSSIKSSISTGTSLSSSPIHYSTGYSNVHMLRNSILNEPTICINQSQTSTIPLTGLNFLSNNVFFQQDKDQDSRPIAIVQGKKNRHNLNEDEDEEVGSTIKKFCVNNNCSNNNDNQQQSQNLQQINSSLNQSSSTNNEFRYLAQQSHSFGCTNLGNSLLNNLQNSNTTNNLACNQSNSTGNQEQDNQLQQTDNANLFSTACCSNAREDCKPQDYRSCVERVQRHANSDFSHLYYYSNRISSPCASNLTPAPQIFNQFMNESSNQLMQGQQSQNGPFLFQQHHRNPSMYSRTHFQYILSANTSMASKVHEDSMTYLNQGQSYEIKLRKISGFETQGNILKSVIRVGFQERRLQYVEKDLLQQWKQQRSNLNERLLEVDIPLSYGVFEIIHPDEEINKVEFAWDPSASKDSGIFIKLNAISTEFTMKKHGGEKGVPFRLIIETHMYSNNSPISLNTFIEGASCQVKVFKPKGADRKHKTDREKMQKRSFNEQQKYLPSYDSTMFKPCTIEALFLNNNIYNNNNSTANTNNDTSGNNSDNPNAGNSVNNSNFSSNNANPANANNSTSSNVADSPNAASNSDNPNELNINSNLFNQDEDCKSNVFMQNQMNSNMDSSDSSNSNNQQNCNNSLANIINFCSSSCASSFNPNNVMFGQNSNFHFTNTPLPANLDSQRVREWLLANRFEKYFSLFQMFNSNDLLNLSREDLIQICNLTDGIRLYNCMHIKTAQPKNTIYLSFEAGLFRAIYLGSFKFDEFREKLLRMVSEKNSNYDMLSSKLKNIIMIGPNQIKILVNEDVISNLTKESMYILHIDQDLNSDKYDLVLKPFK